jgi:hypothetical protein
MPKAKWLRRYVITSDVLLMNQPIGLDVPLAQLPGNNPVFNSSRDSPDYPKRAFADYVETAQIVAVDATGSGICNRTCHDYASEATP